MNSLFLFHAHTIHDLLAHCKYLGVDFCTHSPYTWGMDTIPNVSHQFLVDGLSYHVMLGELSREKAEFIIAHYQKNYPDEDYLDEGILFAVRKEFGLDAPNLELLNEQKDWQAVRETEASIDVAGNLRRGAF